MGVLVLFFFFPNTPVCSLMFNDGNQPLAMLGGFFAVVITDTVKKCSNQYKHRQPWWGLIK